MRHESAKVVFTKNGETFTGTVAEYYSPFSFKVFVEGDAYQGRYPAYHRVSWCSEEEAWIAA